MKSIIFALVLGVLFVSCNDDDEKGGCTDPISINYDPDAEENNGSCLYAGAGGSTTLVLFPEHHGAPIVSSAAYPDSAFIKFNSQTYPGPDPSLYDLVISGEENESHVHADDLKRGKYYVFMTGWDTTINERVTGGIPVIVTQENGEVDIEVPVTE
jgi:hypothetical protein